MKVEQDKGIEVWLAEVWEGELEWDDGNKHKTAKHDVSPEQMDTITENEIVFLGRIIEPEGISFEENRYILLGVILDGRAFALICTIRKEKVRPISCRRMRKTEKGIYDKAKRL